MRVAILTVRVPFIDGGAEELASGLLHQLKLRKVDADLLSIPFKWHPPEYILDCMNLGRNVDLTGINGVKIDRLITLKFPAYYSEHENKCLWLIHQHRQAYDLYGTENGDLHHSKIGNEVTSKIKDWDDTLIPEHQDIFTISQKVTSRLETFNSIESNVLRPPPAHPEKFHFKSTEDFILAPGRFDPLKRQMEILEAMANIDSRLKLIFIGQDNSSYGNECKKRAEELNLVNRIQFMGVVGENEKNDLYSRCYCVYNGVFEEDYGYVTVEAFLSSKPTIVFADCGGPLEFIENEINGFVVNSNAELSEMINKLFSNKKLAVSIGCEGKNKLKELNLNWDYVIDRLLS